MPFNLTARAHTHMYLQVPCHHEDEVLEFFNDLTVEWNVTDRAGEHCHVEEERIHGLLGIDNQSAILTSNLSSPDVISEASNFCESLYLLVRDLLLHLNYTEESCLINGTRGDVDSEETDVPSRLDYGTGTCMHSCSYSSSVVLAVCS